jgi:hypothetical protein
MRSNVSEPSTGVEERRMLDPTRHGETTCDTRSTCPLLLPTKPYMMARHCLCRSRQKAERRSFSVISEGGGYEIQKGVPIAAI